MTRELKEFISFEEEGVFVIRVQFTKLGDLIRIIEFERTRIKSLLERGILPVTEVRVWDCERRITVSMRV